MSRKTKATLWKSVVGLSMAAFLILMMVAFGDNELNIGTTGSILARNHCPNKTGTQLTNLISGIGSRQVELVFDGGAWGINTNVTFPTNISVCLVDGSYFTISNGMLMTFQTNNFLCGRQLAFTGSGKATGTAVFVYRWPEWASVSQAVIGAGEIGITNLDNTSILNTRESFTMDNNTTGDMEYVDIERAVLQTVSIADGTGTFDTVTAGTATVTKITANGINITPQKTETITFTTNMSSATMQSLINETEKYIPYGQALTFTFETGRFTNLESQIAFVGFYGGGNLNVHGTTNGIDETAAYTSQYTVLYWTNKSANTINGLAFVKNECYVHLHSLHTILSNAYSYGNIYLQNNKRVYMSGMYLQSPTTNSGHLVMQWGGYTRAGGNAYEGGGNALWLRDNGSFYSYYSWSTNNPPHTGVEVFESSHLGVFASDGSNPSPEHFPTGVVSWITTNGGGFVSHGSSSVD